MCDPRGSYNSVDSWALDDDEIRLGREWLGYGSFDAPYWFVGLEPGGDYDPLFARYWIESLNAPPLFDPRQDARVAPNPWFLSIAEPQPTWRPLIETVLGYTGSAGSVLDYQLKRFGCTPPSGETATLELSAFAAKGSRATSPHRETFLTERVAVIRDALSKRDAHPEFAVFYGTTRRAEFGDIVGGFDTHGFQWLKGTLCCLVPHPKAWGPRTDWRALGVELRHRIETHE